MKQDLKNLDFEVQSGFPKKNVIGVDEVGRGCLAGPVVAAAVLLPSDLTSFPDWVHQVTDSKKLSPKKREMLEPLILAWVRDFAIASAEVSEIDRLNIHHATHLAMSRAIQNLKIQPDHILVDGKFTPKGLPVPSTAIVSGDSLSLSIACASIIAKVQRDRQMTEMESLYPGYGFSKHKGYGTAVHLKALQNLGICKEHRLSFAPVRDLLK